MTNTLLDGVGSVIRTSDCLADARTVPFRRSLPGEQTYRIRLQSPLWLLTRYSPSKTERVSLRSSPESVSPMSRRDRCGVDIIEFKDRVIGVGIDGTGYDFSIYR